MRQAAFRWLLITPLLTAHCLLPTGASAQVPGIINYQGRVVLSGTNLTGTGQFKFALVDGSGGAVYWSSGATPVALPVSKGLYSVLLGDTSVPNMGSAVPASVFANSDVRLRVWFDGGAGLQQLTPDQRIGAVGYAFMAADVPDGAIGPSELATASASLGKVSGGAMAVCAGNVGIGTATPQAQLAVCCPGSSDPVAAVDVDVASFGTSSNAAASHFLRMRDLGAGTALILTGDGKLGVGTGTPQESLDVPGAVKLGTTANPKPAAGTIRWTGTDFQGFNGQQWLSMTAPTPAGMVLVPGGTFTMGCAALSNEWDACTEHQVTLGSYYFGKYEVTYALWYSVRQWATNHGYAFQNAGREGNNGTIGAAPTADAGEPATSLNWRDAIVWCNARSQKENLAPVYTYTNAIIRDSRDANATACDNAVYNTARNGYRLPTEAEWEYAARYTDGISETPGDYASGGGFSAGIWNSPIENAPACEVVAWYYGNSSNRTYTVGTRMPNQLGIYDMSGNIQNLCWDWYEDYTAGVVTNPTGPATGSWRVQRGGSYDFIAFGTECAMRHSISPSWALDWIGFRCARSAQ